MKFFPCLIVIVTASLTLNTSFAQKPSSPIQAENLSEWFLATGDWNNDPKIYVKTYGSGEDTVILLHGGWGGEHRSLIDAVQGLEEDYFFVTYDQRGSLRSPFPDSLITFQEHIEDLERLRKELRLSQMSLAGHSMGTILASAYHEKYPDRVKKLILLAPARLRVPIPEEDQKILAASDQAFQAFRNRPEIEAELKALQLWDKEEGLSSLEHNIKFRISRASMFFYDIRNWRKFKGGKPFFNPKSYQLTNQSMPNDGWNYIENFVRTKVPVTVIVGDHDFLDMGGKLIQKWMKEVPDSEVILIPKAGHEIWADQPERFREALKKGLER